MALAEITIADEMAEGEELVWSASPDPKAYASRCMAFMWILIGLLLASVFVFALAMLATASQDLLDRVGGEPIGYWVYVSTRVTVPIVMVLLVPIGLAGLVLRMPFSERRKASGTLYALTNRRVIRFQQDKRGVITRHENSVVELSHLSRVERPSGYGDLIFQPVARRSYDYTHQTKCVGGFFGISDVSRVERLLRAQRDGAT